MRTKLVNIMTISMTVLIAILGTLVFTYYFNPFKTSIINKTIKDINITETNTLKSAIDKAYNSVVLLESYQGTRLVSSGTGFIYKKDDKYGYIITNNHVVEDATTVKVTNIDGQTVDAKVLGTDVFADIAVLSIDKAAVLQVAEIGSSDLVSLGDTVFTIGSPLGKEYMGTVTKGILSGKNRSVTVNLTNGDYIATVLQTDAAINPGNSGGPLLNINGQVIGVNSLKLVKSEIEGMGFALPIEEVMVTANKLEKGEEIKRPYLGAGLADIDETYYLYTQGVYVDNSITKGAVITQIDTGKPADDAGIKKGDVVVELNGVKTDDAAHFRYNLYKYNIGDTITVKYFRGKELKTTTIKLDESL